MRKSGITFPFSLLSPGASRRRRILIPLRLANQNKAHSARTYAQCQCFASSQSVCVHCYLRNVGASLSALVYNILVLRADGGIRLAQIEI